MLAVRDTLAKNPHTSLFVLFVGAFTVFALSQDDSKRKNSSLLKRVISYFIDDTGVKDPSKAKRTKVRPTAERSNGIVVLLENKPENVFQSCWAASMRTSLFVSEDGTGGRAPLEHIIEQLRVELQEEREKQRRLHDSVKREEALRLDVEEGQRLLEKELVRQKRKTRKLKKEKSRLKMMEKKLREEEAKVYSLEKRLESEQARAERLEREVSKYKNGYNKEESEEDDSSAEENNRQNLSGSGGKKWIFTII